MMVVAFIYESSSQKQTKGYRHVDKNGILKELIKPIPGNYSASFENPLSPEDPITEYYHTNEDGEITFDQMYFSTYGRAESYQIQFLHLGVSAKTEFIQVKSTISKIVILR